MSGERSEITRLLGLDVLRQRFSRPEEIDTAIHPADEMFLNASAGWRAGDPGLSAERLTQVATCRYLEVGLDVLDIVEQLVATGLQGFDRVERYLDFASGHGRFTRMLTQVLGKRRIWVSDIVPEALDFQREQFGVHGIASCADPENFACDERFDFISVVSLFSHLPDHLFRAWLGRLYRLLSPTGLLIFSVLSDELLKGKVSVPASGFRYVRRSESRRLDPEIYGGAWVSEDYVRGAILQATGGRSGYLRFRRAVSGHQDLYVLAGVEGALEALRLRHCRPLGRVGRARLDESCIEMTGWAVCRDDSYTVVAIDFYLEGRLSGSAKANLPRADVARALGGEAFGHSGWTHRLALGAPGDLERRRLLVLARSNTGDGAVLFAGTLADLLRERAAR
jgi:SAM-dependent methyltransferase